VVLKWSVEDLSAAPDPPSRPLRQVGSRVDAINNCVNCWSPRALANSDGPGICHAVDQLAGSSGREHAALRWRKPTAGNALDFGQRAAKLD
jgi:hypothetical protein